jgi:hypothetical protein
MTPLNQYRFGLDPWGLILFLLVMLPNFIWFATVFAVRHLVFAVLNFIK